MVGGIAVLVGATTLLPAQVRELRDLRAEAAVQREHQEAMRALAAHLRGTRARCLIEVPGFQDAAAIAVFADLRPQQIVAADRGGDPHSPADLRVLERAAPGPISRWPRASAAGLVLVADPARAGC
jgi:hypothetical protein